MVRLVIGHPTEKRMKITVRRMSRNQIPDVGTKLKSIGYLFPGYLARLKHKVREDCNRIHRSIREAAPSVYPESKQNAGEKENRRS